MNPAEDIKIPFSIAEGPRTFLTWLAENSTLTDAQRKKISDWMLEHNRVLAEYLRQEYGHAATYQANELSIRLAKAFREHVARGYDEANAEMFDRLEEELKDGS